MPAAIGLIEVEGVAGIILAADAAVKTADVDLLGWDSIGGFTTVLFSGSISDVGAALASGTEAARQVVEHVVSAPVTQPSEPCLSFAVIRCKKMRMCAAELSGWSRRTAMPHTST